MKVLSFLTAILLTFPNLQASQQVNASPSTNSPQATTLLRQSLAALTGSTALTDVTLTGSARRIAGSAVESGTATLKALASGAGRIDLSLPSGGRGEVTNAIVAPATGAWSGPDGISHPIPLHNLLSEPAWFFPAFAIAHRLSTTGYVATYVGHETHNGQAVEHVSVLQSSSLQMPPGIPSLTHLSQVDFFLDSTTLLPAAITFNIHPDNDMGLDIPVEIRFSGYQKAGGSLVPYHVQKYLNNGLTLDFQVQTVTVNTGLSSITFSAL